jgi:3-(methylsulfanyl)propanoyl-CoA dehydrogenase
MVYAPPLQDIRFTLEHIVDLPGLSKLPVFAHADIDTVDGLLAEFGRFVAEVLAPLDAPGDREGASHDPATHEVRTPAGFRDAYRRYVEAGWGSVPFEPEYGGGGFPWLVAVAMQELLTSANMGFSLCPLLTQGAIDMLRHHGSEEQKESYLRPMVTGEWTGTMNLTEPEAGSDVGALRTRAAPAADGTWRLSGTKIFITYGEQDLTDNIVHLVLARVPDAPPGTRGISCFIVPKFLPDGSRNRVTCMSIEHKLGIHASPTCVMEYDDATGFLIGEANAGMRYMFTMMNNARLSVGLSGLAVGEVAYQQARAFAGERVQGRPPAGPGPIIGHPDVRRMLLTMRATVEAMRGLIYLNAQAIDLQRHALGEDERRASQELADLLTPVSKAWCTDMGLEVARLATQVHGGMGYIEETGVAQRERDIRIASIYEGTNGIQAMDLVGRKLPMRGGAVVRELLDRMADSVPVDPLREATEWILAHDPLDALAAATPYLRMFGLTVGGWIMARQEAVADDPARVASARFFRDQLLPQAAGLLPAVTAGAAELFAWP